MAKKLQVKQEAGGERNEEEQAVIDREQEWLSARIEQFGSGIGIQRLECPVHRSVVLAGTTRS